MGTHGAGPALGLGALRGRRVRLGTMSEAKRLSMSEAKRLDTMSEAKRLP